ncbi:f81f513d-024a-46fa-ac6d-354259e1e742 [Thermothielavioides terrestris]|uniref:F81f513d-024a-46fa-ac6d-354259e1e742 n=1 Tax=Thermothielavioides terrestris TaxID=2587410 RepID=A0A446B8Z5_9PEZI|nr:f81f513d-024a-46fa-ac6d-354259e1e742 [Thermothielavioides terrestris]
MATPGTQAPASEPLETLDVVETPTSPSSSLARSRFEFETGRGNEGTKILMVEWDDVAPRQDGSSEPQTAGSDWEVSWEGKGDVLPIRDVDPDPDSNAHRIYFLLPRAHLFLHCGGTGSEAGMILRTKPMPAIFPAELASKQDAGRRGVLHTIWARLRLAELQAEIAAEMRANGESVGLEMALQERQWIIDHFGLAPGLGMPRPTKLHIPQSSTGPASPRSPMGGRLGEKLRGLKLATSPAELAAGSQEYAYGTDAPSYCVSTLCYHGRFCLQTGGLGGLASLDAMVESGHAAAPALVAAGSDDTNEEDLFALPMSPRSPEMKRSPFSLL